MWRYNICFFEFNRPVNFPGAKTPCFDMFLQVSRLSRFSAGIAYVLPQNNLLFGNYFIRFPKRTLWYIKLFLVRKITQNTTEPKMLKWTSLYPILEFFSCFNRDDSFNKHDLKNEYAMMQQE